MGLGLTRLLQRRKRPFRRGPKGKRAARFYAETRAVFEKQLAEGNYSPAERAFALAHDMLPDKQGLLPLDRYPAKAFATDVELMMWWGAIMRDPYSILLENKLVTYQLLGPHVATPAVHALYKRGREVPYGGAEPLYGGDLFARPLAGAKGKGAARIPVAPADEMEETVHRLADLHSDLLVTERVAQHPFMDELFAGSVNCARVYTLRDVETGRPHALKAMLRVGTETTQPVDNIGQGAVSLDLDMESGRIGIGLINKPPYTRIETHPDTGRQLTGLVLPGGGAIVQKCLDLHAHLPFNPLIGWDMAIGPNGFILIEANPGGGVPMGQDHGPLLLDAPFRKLLRRYLII